MAALALTAVLLPLMTTGLALAVHGRVSGWLSVATSFAALGCALMLLLLSEPGASLTLTTVWLPHAGDTIQIGLHIDGLSISMLAVVCFVALCVQIFSLGYMADETPADFGRYFAWHSLFLFAMNSLVLSPNLLQLFMGWELVGLASYLLIGFHYKKPSAARAALKAFCLTKLADIGFVAALIVLFALTGSFSWQVDAPVAASVSVLLFIAVMGKSAQFPLHVWLPDAMEGPTPVSALLHAATMVAAGVFLVVRAYPLFEQAPDTLVVMLYVGSFTALFAATVALTQDDIKRVLAYSTCSQLGFMVCALGAGSRAAGFFHLTTHAFFKALLFLAAGVLIHAVHSNDIRHMGGMLRKQRVAAISFSVGALSLAGVPGLSGFFSKDLILEQLLERRAYLPLLMLLVAAFLSAMYMGRVLVALLTHDDHAPRTDRKLPAPLGAPGPREQHTTQPERLSASSPNDEHTPRVASTLTVALGAEPGDEHTSRVDGMSTLPLGAPGPGAEGATRVDGRLAVPLALLALPSLGIGYFAASLTGLYGEPLQLHFSGVSVLASLIALAGLLSAYLLFGPLALARLAGDGGAEPERHLRSHAARVSWLLALFAPLGRLARSNVVDDLWLLGYRWLLAAVSAAAAFIDRYVVDGLMNALGWLTLACGARLRGLQTGNVQDYIYALVIASVLLGSVVVAMQ